MRNIYGYLALGLHSFQMSLSKFKAGPRPSLGQAYILTTMLAAVTFDDNTVLLSSLH